MDREWPMRQGLTGTEEAGAAPAAHGIEPGPGPAPSGARGGGSTLAAERGRLLRSLLLSARRYGASDIHLLVGLPPMFRIAGEVVASKGEPLTHGAMGALLDDALTPVQRARLERDWQLCVSAVLPDCGRSRVTVYRRNGHNEVSIRMSELTVRTREELGLPEIVDTLARKPSGLVILTGPTGVGKTTTFHYMLDLINAEQSAKIVTIEDPIEYVHPFKRSIVVQQEVLVDVRDFGTALRHVLRQDPDVIGVGEMRDAETIYTALMAAETGHLVVATLHTPSAIDVLHRMVSAFPEGRQEEIRFILSGTLQGVVAQQLLPRATEKGRVICCEVLIGTQAVRNHIRDNDGHQLLTEIQSGRKHGMIALDHSLLELYQRGEITYDTAVAHARNPESIRKRAV
ncbi:MAG: type IV pilus twitching motility protein PilT [Phycisphaerales bacterium]